jgi:hypothetical protein
VNLGLSRYTPHAAADVLSNRYGDCRDKHTLFAALLQAVGIPAAPALISSVYRVDPSFASPSLFDHVITAIPRGSSFLFLDTTPEVAPLGLLRANLRGRQPLVMPPGAPAKLVVIPADPPFRQYETVHFESTIDSEGTLDAKIHLEERGDTKVLWRSDYRATPQNRWKELTGDIAAGMGYGGTISDTSAAQPEDTGQAFCLAFSYHRKDYLDWKENRIVLPVPWTFFLTDLTDEQRSPKQCCHSAPLLTSPLKLP